MLFIYFLAYLALCVLVGLMGRTLPLGFIGLFLISFFMSPAVGVLLLVVMLAKALAGPGKSADRTPAT